jgi:photosystem II stability/assembly factor-like uncharacterized protein
MRKKNIILFQVFAGLLILFSCKKDKTVIANLQVDAIYSGGNTINKIAFISASVAFAACDNGILLKTADGGYNWDSVASFSATTDNLLSIQFPTTTTGFVLGGGAFNGNIYKTIDGGTTWTKLSMNAGTIDPSFCSFPTANIGYCLTSTYTYKTTNGGQSWFSITNLPSSSFDPWTITFCSKDTGFVTDFNRYLFRTTNGGTTWTQIYSGAGSAFKIYFSGTKDGLAVVMADEIYQTTDGGTNWYRASQTPAYSNDTDFRLLSVDLLGSNGFAVGDYSITVTKDGGSSWEYLYNQNGVNEPEEFTDVHMISSTSAIASTLSGKIYKITLP